MDRFAQNIDRSSDSEIMNLRRMKFLFDRSAQNIDRSSDSEIMNLRRMKFLFDVAPLEIIDNNDEEFLLFDEEEDENFFHGGGVGVGVGVGVAVMNINQINLVIHAVNHGVIFQYWSLKSDQQQQQQLCYGGQHHRDHHHLREDDDDKEMIIISCQPLDPLKTTDIVLDREGGGVYASSAADDNDDDYIMSQLRDLDILYEMEWIFKPEQLEGVKRCIIQRINESKPAVLLAKPKAVRIRLDLSSIIKNYYANPAAAASAYAKRELYTRTVVAVDFATHYPDPPKFLDYDDAIKLCQTTALKLSKEALETKILEEEDLISSSSSSSSSSCSVCLNEFHVGVDEIKKMPCSHMFHLNCLENWLWKSNTCPLCRHGLPTLWSRFLEDQLP